MDSWAAARKDKSVELGFDSAAFDVFVRPEEDERVEETAPAGNRPAAVVTNVVPFRLTDELPKELGSLLFDTHVVVSSLQADDSDHRPPSRDSAKKRRAKHTGTAEWEGPGSSPGETPEAEETENTLWVKKKASHRIGQVLSHVHHVGAAEGGNGGKVEVRIRGGALDAETLATTGMPKDMAALVVTAGADTSPAGTSKLAGSASVGVASGEEKQGRRKQRAAAH